jgi:hypothetical protein
MRKFSATNRAEASTRVRTASTLHRRPYIHAATQTVRAAAEHFRVVQPNHAAIDIGAAAYNTLGSNRANAREQHRDVFPITLASKETIEWGLN